MLDLAVPGGDLSGNKNPICPTIEMTTLIFLKGHHTPILPEAMVMRTVDNETVIMDGIGMVLYQRPTIGDVGHLSYDPRMANCLRNVAKYLNIASEGRDWAVLAENLGLKVNTFTLCT